MQQQPDYHVTSDGWCTLFSQITYHLDFVSPQGHSFCVSAMHPHIFAVYLHI